MMARRGSMTREELVKKRKPRVCLGARRTESLYEERLMSYGKGKEEASE